MNQLSYFLSASFLIFQCAAINAHADRNGEHGSNIKPAYHDATSNPSKGVKNTTITVSCPACKPGQKIVDGKLVPTKDTYRIRGRCVPVKVTGGEITGASSLNDAPWIEGDADATSMIIPAKTYTSGAVEKGDTAPHAIAEHTYTAKRDGHLMQCSFEMVGGNIIQYLDVHDKNVTVTPPSHTK